MKLLYWSMSEALKTEIHNHYRTPYALSLKNKSAIEIMRSITFDNPASNITFLDVEQLLSYVNTYFLKNKLQGIGLEAGAGCALFSSLMANNDNVHKMYAVEACEPIATELMPTVIKHVLPENKNNKVVRCVADFNHLEVPDNSIDFVFDFFSLHHSDDLLLTLKEINRVLKPGGFIFCLDKARDDHLSSKELEDMVDIKYGDNFKQMFNIPLEKELTRRMNGEHEFRLKDWQQILQEAKFGEVEYYDLAKTLSSHRPVYVLKSFLSKILLPRMQIVLTNLIPYDKKKNSSQLDVKNRVYSSFINKFPKEMSLLIAYKK